MDVVLKEDVANVGKRGEIVKVSRGYARNYLVPKGLAVAATEGRIREFEMMRRREEKLGELRERRLEELARRIGSISCSVRMRAREDGHLFGGVGPAEIAGALRSEGADIDEKSIRMGEDIRELGVFVVEVHVAPGVVAHARVWVREE